MKVKDLLEANYKPQYHETKRVVLGATKDWLTRYNISDADVQAAMVKVKETSLFKEQLPAAGIMYSPSKKREENGTFNFEVTRKTFGQFREAVLHYQVQATGQITVRSPTKNDDGLTAARIASPKPSLSRKNKIDSLVKTYIAALESLLKYIKDSRPKNDKRFRYDFVSWVRCSFPKLEKYEPNMWRGGDKPDPDLIKMTPRDLVGVSIKRINANKDYIIKKLLEMLKEKPEDAASFIEGFKMHGINFPEFAAIEKSINATKK